MKSEQIKEITEKATEQLVAAVQQGHSEALTIYLKAIGRFHRYSLHNVLLIALQKPNASHVAGFHTWNELGRFVKKGEKGILILAPIVRRKAENPDDDEKESSRIAGFRTAYVFDVRQTNGQDLPHIGLVHGDPCEYRDGLRRFELRKISRSSTRKTSPLPAVLPMADVSRCFQASHLPRSFRRSFMNWRMNFYTVAIAANKRRAKSAKRKPKRPPLSFAMLSGSKPVRPQPTTSKSGTETRKR
jgi:hypothetical protein